MDQAVIAEFMDAVERDDVGVIDRLLSCSADVVGSLNEGLFLYGQPPIARARSVAAASVMLRHGGDLDKVSAWWAPGFHVIGRVDAAVGAWLVQQGAQVTAHAAAALGLSVVLRRMLEADASVVHQPGGDGCRPLHFARTVEVAELLVAHGADVNARDDDHDSTAAQWLIGDAPGVARALVDHGADVDIFLAAALGDQSIVQSLIDADPTCLNLLVGRDRCVPALGFRGKGGTIYQWSMGFNSYPHQYAAKNGHHALLRLMLDRSEEKTRFLVACLLGMREEAELCLASRPELMSLLDGRDLELLARYCWETNANIDAVRLMLDLGWPLDVPETGHCYLPLHNAAWGGYADLVDLLIERGAPVDVRDPEYNSTPLGFAVHCCCEDGRHPEGEYTRVVTSLIRAGSPWDRSMYPTGHEKIDTALEAFL